MEVTLLEAPEAPSRLPSSSLSADSVARLVSAATVEATFAGRFTAELALPLVLAAALGEAARPAAWLLLTLPTDKMTPIGTATAPLIGREAKNLRRNGRITQGVADRSSHLIGLGRARRRCAGRRQAPPPGDHRPLEIPAPGVAERPRGAGPAGGMR
jgi:hypothetical protein